MPQPTKVIYSKMQMFLLMQHCVMQIKTNGQMSLSRMAKPFLKQFKKDVGIPARADNQKVLLAIGMIYKNQLQDEAGFFEYINKEHYLIDGKPLVTPEDIK